MKIKFLIITILLIGLFFRFYHLDYKVYWFDETFTSLRISGYSDRAVVQKLSEASIIGIEDLQKYQQLTPDKGVFDTINTLASEEPQLTPLYFVLARFWAQLFGQSIAVTRLFPVLTSLLAFPCLYWLCQELFESPLVAEYSLSLLAVSPFFLIYSQEARPYSLWMVVVLLSSATLLRALRLQTQRSWLAYLVTVIIGFYSHLYFALVTLAYGIYVVVLNNFKWTKTIKSFLIASTIGFVSFIPWVLVLFTNVSSVYNTVVWQAKYSTNLLRLFIQSWAGNIGRVYVDFGTLSYLSFLSSSLLSVLVLFVLILFIYGVYFIYKTTSKKVWLFIFTLCGVNAIALTLHNIIIEKLPISNRYLIPFHLGIIVAIAYLFSQKTVTSSLENRHQRPWRVIMGLLLTCQIVSCFLYSQSEIWWNKGLSDHQPSVAKIINDSVQPLVIVNADRLDVFSLISLSYRLNSNIRFLVTKPININIPKQFDTVFIYGITTPLKQNLEKQYSSRIIPVYPLESKDPVWLWKIQN